MYLIGGFVTDSFPDELEDDLDFFRFPIIDPEMPVGEDAPTDGYFIAANADNMDGAKDVLASLVPQKFRNWLLKKWAASQPAPMLISAMLPKHSRKVSN